MTLTIKSVCFVAMFCLFHLHLANGGIVRIVGGLETTIEKRPYQASLQYNFNEIVFHTCGASIISTKFLLTAAHCNPGFNIFFLYARVGSTAYNSGGQVLKVAKFLPHPLFNKSILDYDFAIVSFNSGVEINLGPKVGVVKLSSSPDPPKGTMVTVTGWGTTSEADIVTPVMLREADMPLVDRVECTEVYAFLTDRQICLGGTSQGGLSACFGDSGGPAVINGTQYGIVSGGNSCEKPNIPGIFGKVSSAREWITQNTGV